MKKVGNIEGYDVVYCSEKDLLFCKNTTVKFPEVSRIILGDNEIGSIPEKNLIVTKNGNSVSLGCLTASLEECHNIIQRVNKIKMLNKKKN